MPDRDPQFPESPGTSEGRGLSRRGFLQVGALAAVAVWFSRGGK